MFLKNSLLVFSCLLLISACAAPSSPKATQTTKKIEQSPPIISQETSTDLSIGAIDPATPSIKIALLVPLSGESASVGNAMVDAATLALYDSYLTVPSDQIRAQLTVIPKDTGVNVTETKKATEKAIEQGATFVIGPLFSQSVTAIKPLLQEKNIPMLSFSNNKAVASANTYTFGFLPEQQVERIAEYAYLNKLQRVALLAPNDPYGEKVRDTLSESYTKKGGMLTSAELYAPSMANIDAAVSRIVGAYNNAPEERRFQAIFIADGGAQMHNIIKSLRKSNINLQKIKLLGAGIWDDKEFSKIPELHGAWFPSSPPELYEVFAKRFTTTYGYKPIRLAALAYDAVSIMAKIAMSGRGINAEDLTDSKGFNTPAGGLVRINTTGISDRKLAIMEITPDGFKVVDYAPRNFTDK
ncbi:MAG: penicillin-binding protein activator [Pseudomonadota bacterium]